MVKDVPSAVLLTTISFELILFDLTSALIASSSAILSVRSVSTAELIRTNSATVAALNSAVRPLIYSSAAIDLSISASIFGAKMSDKPSTASLIASSIAIVWRPFSVVVRYFSPSFILIVILWSAILIPRPSSFSIKKFSKSRDTRLRPPFSLR